MGAAALPYVDTEIERPGMRERVRRMIEEEMQTFRPTRDYVAHIRVPELALEETQLLQSEMLRISEGQRMPALDMSRLQMDVPAHNRQNDPAAWRQAVQNAQSQLEHQANRLDNVELFQQHGASAWRAHLVQLEGMVRNLQQQQEEVRTRTEEINKKRKYEQLEAAKKLLALEDEWLAAVQKNRMIEAATERARADHAALERAGSLAAS